MSRTSSILLSDTVGQVNPVGEKVQGSAFFGVSPGNHTIAVTNATFTGRLIIEASLAHDPQEEDWFQVDLDPTSANSYFEFTNSSGVYMFNFAGNYVFLRAKIDRTYLTTPADPSHGSINKILLNF